MPARQLEELLQRRQAIRRELRGIGDLRPGFLFSRFRRCGKANCHCARENAPGHGPSWFVQRRVGQKLQQRAIPVRALDDTRRQIDECHRLQELTRALIEVNERICQLRLRTESRDFAAEAPKKGASRPNLRQRASPRSSA